MKIEKITVPFNGYLALVIILITGSLIAYGFNSNNYVLAISLLALFLLLLRGLIVISPNSSAVLLLFGAYKGSVKQNGLFWINPFYYRLRL